jgi:hypothetical protein
VKLKCNLCDEIFESEDFSGMVDENGDYDITCPNGCIVAGGQLTDNGNIEKADE